MDQRRRRLALGSPSPADARTLIAPFVDPAARWGIVQSVDDGGPVATVARWVEQSVLHETYGVDEAAMAQEMTRYDPATVWHLLIHHPTGSPVGAVRCLVGEPIGFQFTSDLDEYWGLSWEEACDRVGLEPRAEVVEGASFSVLPEWRTADNLWPIKMVSAAYMHLVEDLGAVAAVQIVNPVVRRAFARYGAPFSDVAEPRWMPGWGDGVWDPTISLMEVGNPWFATSDEEFGRLFRDRDEGVRGGTTLPDDASRRAAIDLRDRRFGGDVIDLRDRILEREGLRPTRRLDRSGAVPGPGRPPTPG